MEDTHPVRAARPTPNRSRTQPSRWRTAFKIASIVLLLTVCAAAGAGLALLKQFNGDGSVMGTLWKLPGTAHTFMDPRSQFQGRDRITVLCMGLDRNIIKSKNIRINGMPSTKAARTDVMMLVTLDLRNQTASILSLPRDTRVDLPGDRRGYDKINAAHMYGGIPYTLETVQEFLDVDIDHHVVIKQEAIEKVVDALGGVNVDVEKDMDYDDDWGQLHIHLKEGRQRLTGEQLVGYMRFRNDAEGDFGRIRRQQQAIQALKGELKSPSVLAKAGNLITAIRRFVKTDLTPDQQLALATLFYKLDTNNMVTASLPVADTATIGGASYVIADEEKTEAMVDWMVRGNEDAMNQLVRIELKNASGEPELYQQMYRILRHQGYQVWRSGRASGEPIAHTRVVQRSNLRGAGRRVLATLGVSGHVTKEDGDGSDITLYVGQDLLNSPLRLTADGLEDLPDARLRRVAHSGSDTPRRRERRRRSRDTGERRERYRVSPEVREAEEAAVAEEETSSESAPDAGALDRGGESSPPPDEPGTSDAPDTSQEESLGESLGESLQESQE